jgi:hypothetical protein
MAAPFDPAEPSPPQLPPDAPRPQGQLSAALLELAMLAPDGGLHLRDLFETLAGRGHAALLVVLSFPFCLPVPLPGLSVVFGVVLAFVGLRIAFARRPWLPRWILERPLRREILIGLAKRLAAFEKRTSRMLRPRLVYFCRDVRMHRVNGILVAIMGALLALPLPIPFTNIPAALPVLLLGLGLLEDDGRFVIFGYAAAFFAFGVFAAIFWYGGLGLDHIIKAWRQRWE